MRPLLACQAYAHLLSVRLRVRRLSARALLEDARESASASACDAAEEERMIEAAQRAFALAERVFPARVTCLQRSIALQRLLESLGVITQLRIGVRKDPSELAAHAWLEHRGRTLDAQLSERFDPLRPLPSDDK